LANKVTIGVLGPKFTYSDFATDRYIPKCEKKYYSNIWEVFDALKRGEVEKGIVPIENSIHGTVRETFDSLFKSDLKIITQISLPIHHCIAVLKGTKKKDIKKIISHQQALSQSQKYLRKNYAKAEQIGFSSTGKAIEAMMRRKSGKAAVLCSVEAARRYKLRIIDKNIEDQKGNKTWFAVLGYDSAKPKGKNIRTSIAFHFKKDHPGTLFSVFKAFNDAKVNMTKIESRPTLPKWGDYIFFLDFEGDQSTTKIAKLLKLVEKKVALLKNFGSYNIK
jgi:prephenate dehydratase